MANVTKALEIGQHNQEVSTKTYFRKTKQKTKQKGPAINITVHRAQKMSSKETANSNRHKIVIQNLFVETEWTWKKDREADHRDRERAEPGGLMMIEKERLGKLYGIS